MKQVNLTIDGRKISCSEETTVLDAAETNGISIPKLCHHRDLKPVGACRLCIVEDETTGRIMASCVTPVIDGMSVLTSSEQVIQHRRNIIRLMMAEHPESCLVCNKGNSCDLRRIAAELGIGETGLYPMPNYIQLQNANPFIVRDLSKCILCGKCIRADHELVCVGAIDYNLRGFNSRPATFQDEDLQKTGCTFCGTCVSICPTGALFPNHSPYVGTPEHESLSICGFCGAGCSLFLSVAGEKVVEVNPSSLTNTVNGATLCVRGHFGSDFLNSEDRLLFPMIRKNGELVKVSWEDALEVVNNRLNEIKTAMGPQRMAFIGSSKCTNEENYIFQKIARILFKTNNIDNGCYTAGRYLHAKIDKKTGGRYRSRPLTLLEKSEVIFVIGSNPSHSVPVAAYYLKRAAKLGIPLIVADPVKTDLAEISSVWLPLKPKTDFAMINGIAASLYSKNAFDKDFIKKHTQGFERYVSSLALVDMEKISRITGIEPDLIEKVSEILAGKKIALVAGNGVIQQKFGDQAIDAIFDLLLITGSLNIEGAGLFIPAKENNQVGAWDMGAVSDSLPGRMLLNDNFSRKKWEKAWGDFISPDQGLNLIRIIEEAEKGSIKSLYIMGENPVRNLPQQNRIEKAMKNLDFLVVQDIFLTKTAKLADVVLPGAAFSEKEGSFTNTEGRVQSFNRAVLPPGDAKPDWEILSMLSKKNKGFETFNSIENIREEIERCLPEYNFKSSDNFFAWEKNKEDLCLENKMGKPVSFSSSFVLQSEPVNEAYPFTAIIGSVHFHLGGGTRTTRSDRIRHLGLKGEIGISYEDSKRLKLNQNDTVRLISVHGNIERKICIDNRLSSGILIVPLGVNNNDGINLIGLICFEMPDAPGWKTCNVKLEKI